MDTKNSNTFFNGIDWNMLKDQKYNLLETLDDLEYEIKEANSAGEPDLARKYEKHLDSIKGVIALIDNMQDYVVDELGYSENDVFNLKD